MQFKTKPPWLFSSFSMWMWLFVKILIYLTFITSSLKKPFFKNENSQNFHMIQTIWNHMVKSIFNFNKS